MTQVKLWQIVSQTANGIIFSDADGNLKTLPAGAPGQLLVAGPDGAPMWADNSALATALQAQTDASDALATAKAYTEAQIAALVDNAPVALNTLNELAVKLNGEDSAINALLLQVDGKAEKTEVATAVAQAKQDTLSDSKSYTDAAIGSITGQMGQTRDAILAQAATDAANRAAAAQTGAVQSANAFTAGEVAAALVTASQDAATKVSAMQDAIPGNFWVEGTSTACYVASSTNFDKAQAMQQGLSLSGFVEVTASNVSSGDTSLYPKLLFVNGVAMSDEWTATSSMGGPMIIRFSQRLADHVFDGTENSLMVLAEYRSYNNISLRA